jgi:hypothetical protein
MSTIRQSVNADGPSSCPPAVRQDALRNSCWRFHRIAGCELGAHRAASRLLPGRGLMLWVWASIVITNRLLEPRAARCRSGFSIPQWHWDPGCRA